MRYVIILITIINAYLNVFNMTEPLPNYLQTVPEMYGIKQESKQYNQGFDIQIEATIRDGEKPVFNSDYTLCIIMKDSLSSNTAVWQGKEKCGIYFDKGSASKISIKIPREVSKCIPSGTYYLAIVGTLKTDITHSEVLWENTISIKPSAGSPYPITSDPVTKIYDIDIFEVDFYMPISYLTN